MGLLSWFGKDKASPAVKAGVSASAKSGSKAAPPRAGTPAAPRAPSREVAAAPAAARAPASNSDDVSDAEDKRHYGFFADVPKFSAVLTDGERPVVKLSPSDRKSIVVIELTGRNAEIIVAVDVAPDNSVLESVRGAFIAERFMLVSKSSTSDVIGEIYRAATRSGTAGVVRTGNPYMENIKEWIKYALENDATDIHMDTHGSVGSVRFRIHGEIEEMRTGAKGKYPSAVVLACMATLYNQMQMKKSSAGSQFEAEKNLYCMIPFTEIPGHSLKLRYQSIRGNEGPKTVLRLLHVNESQETLTFERLGYEASHCELLSTAMNTPSGAVLFAGITGSGKSTTLKSFIELNPSAPYACILTAEDPVEYPIRYAHQVPLQRDMSNPVESARMFNETTGAFMRLDPDIAMMGEIRDRLSAMALQQLVESGHMGLGTVHAHLLSGIVPRLTNPEIGMNREVLAAPNMLTLLVYQALVPILCQSCAMNSKQAAESDPAVTAILKDLHRLDLPESPFRWRRVGGCAHCKQRGTVGLTVVAEMMMPDDDWLRCIRDGRDTDAVACYRAMSDGELTSSDMTGKTAFEHTLYKAFQGRVDARQCSRFDVWARFMSQHSKRVVRRVA